MFMTGRKAWHYVEVRRNVVHIFLQKTRAGQDGERFVLTTLLACLLVCMFSVIFPGNFV